MTKQCICFGGGEVGGNNPWNDLYVIAQSQKKLPKVCLLPTASSDNRGLINYFMQSYDRYPCVPSYLELFSPSVRDLEGFIMDQDIIVVTGGQSKSMLGIWREWGVDKYLKKAYDNGTIMSGGSAGAVCWFESCITDSFPGALSVMPALGFLSGSFSPHFSSQERRSTYHKFLASGEIQAGFAADDGAGLHFVDGELLRAISAYPHAQAHALRVVDGAPRRDPIPTAWLEMPEAQDELIWKSKPFSNEQ